MKKKILQFIIPLISTCMTLTACASNGKEMSGSTSFMRENAYEEKNSYDSVGGAYTEGDEEETYYEDGDAGTADEIASEGTDIPEETTDTDVKTKTTIDREKIVYSGSLFIETLTYEDTVKKLYDLVEKKGGIIQSENSSEYSPNYSSDRTARTLNLTIRIPAKEFRSFIKGAEGIGKVTNMNTQADNITKNYYDVASRRASLRTELDRLNELLEVAETTEDLLSIMDRIAYVQGDLDSLEAQLRNMDTDVAYSTMTIDIDEVIEYSVTPQGFGERVADAVVGSWHNFIYVVQNIIIFLIYLLPAVIAFLVFAVVVLIIIFICHKKHIAKGRKKGQHIKGNINTMPLEKEKTGVDEVNSNETTVERDDNEASVENENGNEVATEKKI